jgi:hypothetical protein
MEPEAEPSATPTSEGSAAATPSIPSRSEAGGWYDGPTAADATSEAPGEDRGAAPDHSEPDSDDATKGGERNLMMDAVDAKQALRRVWSDFQAEGFQFDEGGKKTIDAVTRLIDKALDDAKDDKFDHQSFRDQILQHGVSALRDADKRAGDNQRKVWNDLNSKWQSETRNAPDIGGPRLERSLATAKALIEEYGGSKAQQSELMRHIQNNGMGNYAGFIRLLANIGNKLNVFEDFSVGAPSSPAQSHGGQRGAPGSGRAGWYTNSTNNGGM